MNNNLNLEVETKLAEIKKQSDLRTKYLKLVEKELENNDIHSLVGNKKIQKLELKIKKYKNNI